MASIGVDQLCMKHQFLTVELPWRARFSCQEVQMPHESVASGPDESSLAEIKQMSGRRIEDERRRQGLTQPHLARRAGLSVSWIREIESGNPRTKIDDHLRCAAALGLSGSVRNDSAVAGLRPRSHAVQGARQDLSAPVARWQFPRTRMPTARVHRRPDHRRHASRPDRRRRARLRFPATALVSQVPAMEESAIYLIMRRTSEYKDNASTR